MQCSTVDPIRLYVLPSPVLSTHSSSHALLRGSSNGPWFNSFRKDQESRVWFTNIPLRSAGILVSIVDWPIETCWSWDAILSRKKSNAGLPNGIMMNHGLSCPLRVKIRNSTNAGAASGADVSVAAVAALPPTWLERSPHHKWLQCKVCVYSVSVLWPPRGMESVLAYDWSLQTM